MCECAEAEREPGMTIGLIGAALVLGYLVHRIAPRRRAIAPVGAGS